MNLEQFNSELLNFLNQSTTPFHATQQIALRLNQAGFEALVESETWPLKPGGRYYVVRNGSSIVAFTLGASSAVDSGFRMIGAHTDSPCLKVKPHPELIHKGYFQLGVEVYGGALLNPWFDRDLSLAGRVSFKAANGTVQSALIDFKAPIATIPSLAIHLDRGANENRSINAQKDIPPIVMQTEAATLEFRQLLMEQLQTEYPESTAEEVLDYELSFYDTQPASLVGLKKEFIAGARLDNLLSCYLGMQTIINATDQNCVLVCNDHEEVGSQSAVGAQGPMLKSILSRIVDSPNDLTRALGRSMMISADNAHAVHPNFLDKHDGNHGPLLNAGPVIKINANQRYATNSETSALFRQWCGAANEAVQAFVVRTDMACGSTIGPISASELGVKTLDIGVPTFGMHSIRETAGSRDCYSLYRVLSEFCQAESVEVGQL